MNKNEQHKNQNLRALEFTGKAKFTPAQNLQLAAGRTRRGLPTELVKAGLLVCRDMIGLSVFGLSKKGANLVSATPFDIHKLTIGRVDHGLIAYQVSISFVLAMSKTIAKKRLITTASKRRLPRYDPIPPPSAAATKRGKINVGNDFAFET